ncbi:MAG: hypothetical protein IJ806_12220 [Ruminococcus sp.]|nr:hypothetical protein [Ruminococcus sp.]
MKKNSNNVKRIKRDMVISTIAMAIGLIGIILLFVKEKKWDAVGCSILACNAVIFWCSYDALKKAADEKEEE